ncbi:MAG: hypothetical protein AAF961_03325 [Planctomycetota bacterium]
MRTLAADAPSGAPIAWSPDGRWVLVTMHSPRKFVGRYALVPAVQLRDIGQSQETGDAQQADNGELAGLAVVQHDGRGAQQGDHRKRANAGDVPCFPLALQSDEKPQASCRCRRPVVLKVHSRIIFPPARRRLASGTRCTTRSAMS